MNYKTIQVTPKEYELLMKLYKHLIKQGTKSIEESIGKEFNVDEIMKELERTTLAKGAVAGLAIAISIHLLKKQEEI
ncbi:MAG: hypothetical protein QF496_00830 [Dehalococcoidia bacterium]|mgnify:FL=1|jgi:hypothetical protein|nr:hypothetical protein [Dehalococcoidia bacterium]|tara:strand:- start:619 stop:849 length:231 start_codon:yes stop_codon:yes gene_type:complete